MKPLAIGDRAVKVKGYKFVGTVVAIFTTLAGQKRLVVEMDVGENGGGLLHIFNEEQVAAE